MKEITNADGSRNWEANILLDNIKRMELENAELKAENDRLKEEIKEVKKYQYQQEYLNKEIEEMQKALKTLAEGLNKRQMLLQEIKAIAEKLMADNLCNNCDGIGLDANCQDTGCPYYQMDAILQKITKAEEE